VNTAWLFFFCILGINLVICIIFITSHGNRKQEEKKRGRARRIISAALDPGSGNPGIVPTDHSFIRSHRWLFLEECLQYADTFQLSDPQKTAILGLLSKNRIDVLLIRDLHSKNQYKRVRAVTFLPLILNPHLCPLLINTLEREKNRLIKLYLINALTKIGTAGLIIPSIIDSLSGEPLYYQRKIWGLLTELGNDLVDLVPLFKQRTEKEIRLLLIHFARYYRSSELQTYLEEQIDSRDLDIAHEAARVLSTVYVASMNHKEYLTHTDFLIRNLVAESLGNIPSDESLRLLFNSIHDQVIKKSATLALTTMIRKQPKHFKTVLFRCIKEENPTAHATLVDVLSQFVDYIMEQLLSPEADVIECVLFEIMQQGKMKDIIAFLNQNANNEIKLRALKVVRWLIRWETNTHEEEVQKSECIRELRLYLKNELLGELQLLPLDMTGKRLERKEHSRRPLLYLFLFIGILGIPVMSFIFTSIPSLSGHFSLFSMDFLYQFVFNFNGIFALYAGSLNIIYILLLFFSIREIRDQSRIDSLMMHSFLFREYILPSISIISPAFNEEASIVESVSSLLTLRYPDYEIIVVNDGSTDSTLKKLVSHFELERTEKFIHKYLNTQKIRGVYANKRFPELIVIDKENGGKADSLNAGINIATKEYFAGIDADSLLERDALLNLAGLFLYSEKELVAAGGNILPVNGCRVKKGTLVSTRIPQRHLARFQTIEYLRAFMAGRVGWSALKLLLIISGAFGVFHRRTVVNAHGYLTQSGKYMTGLAGKDTVGEDMELVVRLIRSLRESKTPFSVKYGYNANCWTEIPESSKILVRQRDRWQRGLLDIITFHIQMLFNPTYGRIGFISFPYFLFYEVLGPWFEMEGYIVLITSLVLGWINLSVFLVVFTATILLGILVSFFSLILAEYKRNYFPLGDKFGLILYAFLENFGFRQFMNFLRIKGFFSMMANVAGWGQMERKGLGTTNE
jgi:peptidoglycan-N-acetylglucosamine deacetylase